MKPNLTLQENHSKIQVINLVRSLSIFIVLGTHFSLMTGFQHPSEGLRALSRFFQNGPYGVSLFFVLSGFLITRLIAGNPGGLKRPSWKEFYIRRVARIFPLLTLNLFLGITLLVVGGAHTWRLDFCFRNPQAGFGFLFWLSILTFTFNWYRIYGEETGTFGLHWDVLWSLAIEEQFYLFYPLLLKRLGGEKKLMFFLAGVICLGPMVRYGAFLGHPHNYLISYTNSFSAFDQIAWGALLYLVVRQGTRPLTRNKSLSASLAILGFLGLAAVYFGTSVADGFQRVYAPTLLAMALCLFLAGALHLEFFESRALTWLSWLGQASYGAYLLQAFGLYLAYPLIENLNPLWAFLIFTVFMTLLAQVSYRYFEIPLNFRVRKFFHPQ